MEPNAVWASLGGIGGLAACLGGLILALRTGILASGMELNRLQRNADKQLAEQAAAHASELARLEKLFGGTIDYERTNAAKWQQNTEKLQGTLDVALEANSMWARQAEMSAVTSDLTNRVLDTLRQQAMKAGGSS